MSFCVSCGRRVEQTAEVHPPTVQLPPPTSPSPTPSPSPGFPNLQAELLDKKDKTTASPIGSYDFRNYTYPLPRGWQNPDGTDEITLKNG
ncbi:MAG: hypothetical protein JO314_13945, partial [Acidobacteria bacterium]|nr:hypothetical protein [Acidobacteriota bacterium]